MTYQAMAAETRSFIRVPVMNPMKVPTVALWPPVALVIYAGTMAIILRTSIGLFTRKEILRKMQRKSSLPNH